VIWLERNGKIISVDSRPSDALALALRADCPIYVDEEVIRTSKSSNAESERLSNDELRSSGRVERRGFGEVQDVMLVTWLPGAPGFPLCEHAGVIRNGSGFWTRIFRKPECWD